MNRAGLCEAVRQRLIRLPAPFEHAFGVVPLPPPSDPPDLRPVFRQLEAATRAMERARVLAAELRSPYLVSRVLPRREAVASSAVEGTHSTLDELLTAEEADETPNDATAQVRDYALALEGHLPEAARCGRAIFTEELVQGLHRAVMAADPHYVDRPGEWRTRVVWIGGQGDISRSVFNPPPPADVARCLADSLAYLRCEGGEDLSQHLVTRMAVAHAHFEAVHPFRDGNGRVGRLLMPLMMAAEGVTPLYLAPYVEAHKPAYMAALKAAQQRLAWHEIVGFFCDAVVATVEDLQEMRRALEAQREAWAGRRRFRAGSASLRALDVVPSYPVLTVKRLAALLDVSIPTATAAVDQLVEAGVLVERTGYRRNRVFVAREVLSVLGGGR